VWVSTYAGMAALYKASGGVASTPVSASPTTTSALRPVSCLVNNVSVFMYSDYPFLDAYQEWQSMFDLQLLDSSVTNTHELLQKRYNLLFE
jgi:hypothetical protein